MQLTIKFALLAITLVYGGVTVSALPVRDALVVRRENAFNAREVAEIFLTRRGEKDKVDSLL